ncbi:hypothetical protein SAMD00019534_045540 [Acytostelium subglobosum LB1]|uniref:hypothetical protein n=1 Tax=Acytostelium subglobosum LB1 TaxID=1410327 RepID=UPI000644C512|nr:hypothetical protein SAMD00019534_045540 [Acytostelium subglobosum LB1]GAM21379.1 hypothetical protein SAMD00019534_045540 [Acytostelium subglobosum LB1]|eukprot:XP_012755498.1 hypothetical protein SAMD00019534_045540 [Acytostelium subglobosum LB1]
MSKNNNNRRRNDGDSTVPAKLLTPESVEAFQKSLLGNLISAIKISNQLPLDEDYSYYTTYPVFKNKMNQLGNRLLTLTQRFVTFENQKNNPHIFEKHTAEDVDDISELFPSVVDVVDTIIDKVDGFTDQIDKSQTSSQPNIYIATSKIASKGGKSNEYNMFYGANIQRPQMKFEEPVDNSIYPFIPKIQEKPNAMVPLDPIFAKARVEVVHGKISRTKEQEKLVFPHPYQHELDNLQYTPKQTQSCKEMLFKELDQTAYTWIDKIDQLKELRDKLNQVDEFAVDLEAHNYRSFQGFVCLMQLSTRSEDFIVDTLALRSHMRLLNEPFTNPRIVKVLHGSDSDIKWLQNDFGIYVVNMFDTGQASRILEFPSASLAFLLRFYCNVDANKKFQLADWRIRPVPEEMIKYAREDTHYLLYIYDRLRNQLFDHKGSATAGTLVLEVLRRSKEISLVRYEKEPFDENQSYISFAQRLGLKYGAAQMQALKVLYNWRENIAREEDESVRYVLPNSIIQLIVEKKPTTMEALLACCSPVPPYIKQHGHDLLQEIMRARLKENLPEGGVMGKPVSVLDRILPKSLVKTPAISQQEQQQQQNATPTSSISTKQESSIRSQWLTDTSSNMDVDAPVQTFISAVQKRTASISTANIDNHSNGTLPNGLNFNSDEEDEDEQARAHKKIALMVKSSFDPSSGTAPVFKPVIELQQATVAKTDDIEAMNVAPEQAKSTDATDTKKKEGKGKKQKQEIPKSLHERYNIPTSTNTTSTTSPMDLDSQQQTSAADTQSTTTSTSTAEVSTTPKSKKDKKDKKDKKMKKKLQQQQQQKQATSNQANNTSTSTTTTSTTNNKESDGVATDAPFVPFDYSAHEQKLESSDTKPGTKQHNQSFFNIDSKVSSKKRSSTMRSGVNSTIFQSKSKTKK